MFLPAVRSAVPRGTRARRQALRQVLLWASFCSFVFCLGLLIAVVERSQKRSGNTVNSDYVGPSGLDDDQAQAARHQSEPGDRHALIQELHRRVDRLLLEQGSDHGGRTPLRSMDDISVSMGSTRRLEGPGRVARKTSEGAAVVGVGGARGAMAANNRPQRVSDLDGEAADGHPPLAARQYRHDLDSAKASELIRRRRAAQKVHGLATVPTVRSPPMSVGAPSLPHDSRLAGQRESDFPINEGRLRAEPQTPPPYVEAVLDVDSAESTHVALGPTVETLKQGSCESEDCRILITGCGRSGTHWISELLRAAGVDLPHERIGALGSVSWMFAVDHDPRFRDDELKLVPKEDIALRSQANFSFFPVVHLVRHPLATISSLTTCFCGCGSLRCGRWADFPSWAFAGHHVKFTNSGCRVLTKGACKVHRGTMGRTERAMEHWIGWSQLVEEKAQYRIHMEKLDLRELIDVLGVEHDARALAAVKKDFKSRRKGRKAQVTWSMLEAISPEKTQIIRDMAARWGYGDNVPSVNIT